MGRNELGSIIIRDGVVAKIAACAAVEIPDAGAAATRVMGRRVPGGGRLGLRATDLDEAQAFAAAIHERFPGKLLAYNCSPSFNWKANLDQRTIEEFQQRIAAMGYKYQFVTLSGFHSLNYAMFQLATGYRDRGMGAYSELQQAEFAAEKNGYEAIKHQEFAGTGYFDLINEIASNGLSSTLGMTGSTESEQF
jgi:isocitrate lyase